MLDREHREEIPPDRECVTTCSETENNLTPYPPYPDSLKRKQRETIRKEERFPVRTGMIGSGVLTTGNDNYNSSALSSKTDREGIGQSLSSQPFACGSVQCRVCVALGFLQSPAPAPVVRLPGKTHPLTTPRASARAQRVLEAFLAFQAEHSRPPRLREVFRACGFANYGLMSRYLQLLEIQGRARRVPTGGRGRWRHRWEAVA